MEKRIATHMVFLATLIVSVSVSGQTIRLVSPLNNGVGRIEVFYNGTWGTVCDDGFGADEAKVACRQLGRYKSGLTPRAIQRFGFGGGKIWLDDVSCSGTESSLASCSHRPLGANNCLHSEDVGIICDPSDITMNLTTSHNKGLLQVYHSWRWGTVCDDGFGQVEASVVCRALGYQGGKVIIVPASSNKMWLDDVKCTMRNTDLKDCKHRPWGSDDCSDSEAVGVQCFSFPEDSTAARLVSTTNTPGEGVLELYHGGQWGRVCYIGFGVEEATVVCRMLGHSTIGALASSYLNTGSSSRHVILDKVKCLGTELSLNECLHYPWGSVTCSSIVVRIQCPSANLQIRLNSTTRGRGRVEVLHNNVWGTVCRGSSFSSQEAQVVCKMANLPWTTAYVTSSYGPGEGIIWLSNVDCTGTETSLDLCSHSGWGTAISCAHSSDVGVVCRGATLKIHLEPTGSVLNVIIGQVVSVKCVVGYSNSLVTSFRWTHSGQSYSGQTFSKTITSKADSGSLTCSAQTVRASTRLSVLYPPVVHLEPRNDTLDVGVGEDLRVRCVVDDANPSVHSFQWSHNRQTSTGSTFLKRNISKSDQGELTCTADNGHMMTPGRAATTIHVTSALVIHLEPQGRVLNVILGQVISVVCVVDSFNSPVTSFRWTHKGHSYSGQTFSKTVTSKSDSGSLTCSVGNVLASTRINVWYPPVVHMEPRNDTLDVGVGEDLRVRCVVDDANPSVHSFQWSHNRQTSTGSTFLKRNISKSDQGELTCTADNGHMMTPGRAATTIHVTSALVIHLEPQGSDLNVLLGQVISVVCVVDYSNSPVTSFRWTHNGHSYSGQAFSKTVTSKSDSGSLTCSVGNVLASIRINVWYPPVVHLEPSNDTLDVGVGEDLSVRCVVDDANPGVFTFQWSHNGQSCNGSTFLKRNISKSDQGELICTADNGHMMTPGRAVATVNVRYPPEIHLSPRQDVISVMAGDAVEVECVVDDANPAVTSYMWCHNNNISHGQTFMKHVSSSDAGNLSCSATNEQGTSTVQTTIKVLQASSLIMSDNTTSHNEVIAIVTGSVGILTIILLLIIIIHLRRRLQLPTNHKAKEKSKRSERESISDAIPASHQTDYETMGTRIEGAENIYCQIQETTITDADPDDIYRNDAFEDEEDIDQNLDRPRTSRQRVTTPAQDRYIRLFHLRHRKAIATETAGRIPGLKRISDPTVRNHLREAGQRSIAHNSCHGRLPS
ncbi:uncharacterized protein [Haliotis cracherodii]|uniref:uncharacterized protein n=1 Tax=Haliotis cracherodii TaxID=6455 RepID=UPI0039E85A25